MQRIRLLGILISLELLGDFFDKMKKTDHVVAVCHIFICASFCHSLSFVKPGFYPTAAASCIPAEDELRNHECPI